MNCRREPAGVKDPGRKKREAVHYRLSAGCVEEVGVKTERSSVRSMIETYKTD